MSDRVKRIIKLFLAALLSILVLLVCILGGGYLMYKSTINSAKEEALAKENSINDTTFKRAGNTIVLDKDDEQIAKLGLSTYKYLDLSQVSNYISQGYIAVEDKNFFSEGGIDYKETIKAAVLYIKNRGKVTVGGSTITQQVAKNVLLTQDRTVSRKFTEILLALDLAKRYTKTQILEFYVNNCYYGEGCYGVESAAQYFFSKPAAKLSLAEAATLCGISNNPSLFNPVANPEKAAQRRNIVLAAMLEQHKITQAQYDEAKNTPLKLTIQKPVATPENYLTSYAIDCTVRALMEQDGFKFQYAFKSEEERKAYEDNYKETYFQYDKRVRSGGYTIHTSLDVAKQALLQSALDNGLSDFGDIDPSNNKYCMQGAAVSIDNRTGYVVAIVGGRGDNDVYNRAFLSFRQPGSSIKPLLDYAPAFELGYHPMSQINDQYIPNGPRNEENQYYGPVSLRFATEMSLNTVAYQVLSKIKPQTGLTYLEEMKYAGIHPEDNNPIASIGGFTEGVSPVEQAGGYYTLANGGNYIQPSCVTSVDFLGEKTIYMNNRQGKQVYSPESAYMMTDILKGVISSDYGTGHNLKIDGQIIAGKTGTTENSKDGWFCGYSAYYTTVVWCGYDMPTEVGNLFGSSYPGHIWQDYMEKVHEGLPESDFPQPAGIVFANIDWQGNPTYFDTGNQDMFAKAYLDKAAYIDQEVDDYLASGNSASLTPNPPYTAGSFEKQVLQSGAKETKAEQDAEAAIEVLESLSAKSPSETLDSAFLDAQNKASEVFDEDKRSSYLKRITTAQKALGISGSF
ncbi:transglycosylase domain-containing protein [Desulfosporosinus sp. PR]|uniref:transglycosylase domain-containing protein n=1 Tax=Candidatus Desulfosporosinus nitrosoreducens TaxID=3401928 RepID=UPI0027EF94B6|nr:transglycosylase domain-containing protein [Desulfosporosinus sp. PR]MDQ7097135.1 transglycosylase domain-containing protein [Desulfosporosinus sp. PR]